MSTCDVCGATRLPHLELCLACDAPPMPPPPRRERRFEIKPAGDLARLAGLFVALGAPRELIASQVVLDRFDVVTSLSPVAEARLQALVVSTGAACAPTDRFVPFVEHRATWVLHRAGIAKVATVVIVGGAAAFLGVPWVPLAAVVAGGATVVSLLRIVPRELRLAPDLVSARLELDPGLGSEIHAARRDLREPRATALLREAVSGFVEALVRLRASGAHLHLPELARADRQLLEHLRRTVAVCGSAGRVATAITAAPPERAAELERSRAALLEELEDVPRHLASLVASFALIESAEARRELLAGPLGTLAEIQHDLEAAAEVERLLER